MIGQCQSGPERRASLLRYQINISLRRRVLSVAKRCATWALYGASFVAGAILMLILIQEALRAPLSTVPPAYVESTE